MDLKKLWENCLTEIEGAVSRANFSTWFKNTGINKEEGGVFFVGVPNEFVKDWLSNKYHKLISKTIASFFEEMRGVEYIIQKPDTKNKGRDFSQELMNTTNKELPLQDLYNISKEDNLNPRYKFDSFIVGTFNELAHAASQAILSKPCVYNPFFIYGGTGLGKTHLIQAIGNSIKEKNSD